MRPIEMLICSGGLKYPENYGEINVWMKERYAIDSVIAQWQWENVRKYLEYYDVKIKEIQSQKEFPDMIFTRNAGLVLPGEPPRVILSSFKHKERQGEKALYREWFEKNGFEVIVLPMGVTFEGGGEAIFWRNTLFFGHGFRAPIDTLKHLQYAFGEARIEADVIPLKLVDERFYHLDTAFMPILGDGLDTKDVLVYYPGAFDEESLTVISALPIECIAVTEQDACAFGCNLLAFGNNIIMAKGTVHLAYALKKRGFRVGELKMDEIKKGGGSVYCMTLNLS
ncbi:MAG: hypothetical protein HZC03_01540 [Candidatus Lloydbacteria bacterium]|nr:hypothetical protein [Candidatus Lloydbacteria bacterium]